MSIQLVADTPLEIQKIYSDFLSCLDSSETSIGITQHLPEPMRLRLEKCGVEFMAAVCMECEKVHYIPFRCKQRWCPKCSQDRQRQRIAVLKVAIGDSVAKWITLTQEASLCLADGLQRLKSAFTRIRRTKLGKRLFRTGYYQIECKPRTDGTWHVHMHILCIGIFVPHRKLVAAWGKALEQKQLPSVRINQVSAKGLYRYMTKYATKPQDLTKMCKEQVKQLLAAEKSRLWGSWGNLRELLGKKPEEKGTCTRCHKFLTPWFVVRYEYGKTVLEAYFHEWPLSLSP